MSLNQTKYSDRESGITFAVSAQMLSGWPHFVRIFDTFHVVRLLEIIKDQKYEISMCGIGEQALTPTHMSVCKVPSILELEKLSRKVNRCTYR